MHVIKSFTKENEKEFIVVRNERQIKIEPSAFILSFLFGFGLILIHAGSCETTWYNVQMYILSYVSMTDSLDCRLDSSLRLQHLCGWDMIVSIQMFPC